MPRAPQIETGASAIPAGAPVPICEGAQRGPIHGDRSDWGCMRAPSRWMRRLGFVALTLGQALGQSSAPRRVLLVDLDDVGVEILDATDTPGLDAMSSRGRTFRRFYSAPMCTATRALMNLGARGSRQEVLCTGNVSGTNTYKLPTAPFESLAQVVTDEGLRAAKVGKWHLCDDLELQHPLDHGWWPYIGVMGNPNPSGGDWYSYPENQGGALGWVAGTYMTTREAELGMRMVDQGYDLVSVSFHAIHKPFHEPPAALHAIPLPLDTDWKRAQAALQALDRELERLVVHAEALGYTVIVFSDNGLASPLGGLKGTVWEGGVHTILWASGPGIPAGEDDALIEAVDVYATVLELLGLPQTALRGPDSTSFAPQLLGGGGSKSHVLAERGGPAGVDPRDNPDLWRRMVREDRYKLIVNQDGLGQRLFDLWADPFETTDLLLDPQPQPGVLLELRRLRALLGQL